MRKRLSLLLIAFGLSSPAGAETVAADCDRLLDRVEALGGYEVDAPPAGSVDGWCVLDGATLRAADGGPLDLVAGGFRLRGEASGEGTPGSIIALEIRITDLRPRPRPAAREMDERLRTLLRLQSADLGLRARLAPDNGALEIREGLMQLSGGTELLFAADLLGAGFSRSGLALGALTALDLEWRNDGRLPRPLMEMAGERLPSAPTGGAAVDAARAALVDLVAALPEAMFAEGSRDALARMVAGLPQGRGRLRLSLGAPDGIGAARLLIAGMSDDPTGPDALAALLAGTSLSVDWRPGIGP